MRQKFLKMVRKPDRTYYYHRRPGKPVYPVSEGVDIDDWRAVEEDFRLKESGITWVPSADADVRRVLRLGVWRAKERADKYNREFDLTLDAVLDMYERQQGKCAISDMKFSAEPAKHGRANPFRPSIDRIDNTGGYTIGNVQIVLAGVNIARSDFSDEEYFRICRAVARNN